MKHFLRAVFLLGLLPSLAWGQPVISTGASFKCADGTFPITAPVAASFSGSGDLEIIALTADKQVRLMHWVLESTADVQMKFTYGTGTNCGTGTADLVGATDPFATAGRPVDSGDLVHPHIFPASQAVCLNSDAAADITGYVVYCKEYPDLSVLSVPSTSGDVAALVSDETGTGALVFADTPTLVTPVLGVATATSVNGTSIPSSKTLTVTTDKLSVFAATTSAELAGVLSDEQGSGGGFVRATSPTLTTPTLGVATATSINKMAITAPATSSTLAVADGKTLTASNTVTFTGTDSSSVDFGAGGTIAYTASPTLTTPTITSLTNTLRGSIPYRATDVTPDGTQCAAASVVTINSGALLPTIICADNDASTIYGWTEMPDNWDGGTVTLMGTFIQTAADTNAMNSDVAAACRATAGTINNTWGTEIAMDIANMSGSNKIDKVTTAAVTPNGTCTGGGKTLEWRWQLDATGTTTDVTTLHVVGFKLEYGYSALSN